MIRINRQTDYAIRIILALAKHPPGTRIPSSRISDDMLIPPALSQRIVAALAHGEFIHTFPGRDGGLELARPADQINMLQVVEFMEGAIDVSDCLVSGGDPCAFENECPVRERWARLRKLIHNELKTQTFDTLAQEASEIEGKSHASLNSTETRYI